MRDGIAAYIGVPALLEREPELAEIDALLDATVNGTGRALLIDAPAGLGKTALVSQAVESAKARGMEVLTARGGELEHDLAFGVARDLLTPTCDG